MTSISTEFIAYNLEALMLNQTTPFILKTTPAWEAWRDHKFWPDEMGYDPANNPEYTPHPTELELAEKAIAEAEDMMARAKPSHRRTWMVAKAHIAYVKAWQAAWAGDSAERLRLLEECAEAIYYWRIFQWIGWR